MDSVSPAAGAAGVDGFGALDVLGYDTVSGCWATGFVLDESGIAVLYVSLTLRMTAYRTEAILSAVVI